MDEIREDEFNNEASPKAMHTNPNEGTEAENVNEAPKEETVPIKCDNTINDDSIPFLEEAESKSIKPPLITKGVLYKLLFRFEFAFRMVLLGIVPIIIIAFQEDLKDKWIHNSLMVTFTVIAVNTSFGRTMSSMVGTVKAFVLNIIIGYMIMYLSLDTHWAAWGFIYLLGTAIISIYTHDHTAKITLFLYTIQMHMIYEGKADWKLPLELVRDCCVGASLGIIVIFLPFPRFEAWICQNHLKKVYSLISVIFPGLMQSVWVTNNTVRIVNMEKVRSVRQNIEREMVELDQALEHVDYELLPAQTIKTIRKQRVLAGTLISIADAMISFVNSVIRQPASFDGSEMFQVWGSIFAKPLEDFAQSLTEFFAAMTNKPELTQEDRDKLAKAKGILDEYYLKARHTSMFEDRSWVKEPDAETRFPLIPWGWFLFNVISMHKKLVTYQESELSDKENPPDSWFKRAFAFTLQSPSYVVKCIKEDTYACFIDRTRNGIVHLREALKVSFSMTVAIAVLIIIGNTDPVQGGAVIGFVAEVDETATVGAGLDFLLGGLCGSVIGYVGNAASANLTENILWSAAIAFGTGLIRTGTKYGRIGFFMQLFALITLTPGYTEKEVLTNVQNNVWAISWFIFIVITVFPARPTLALRDSIRNNVTYIAHCLEKILEPVSGASNAPDSDPSSNVIDVKDYDDEMHHLIFKAKVSVKKQQIKVKAAADEPSLYYFPHATYNLIVMSERHLVAMLRSLSRAIVIHLDSSNKSFNELLGKNMEGHFQDLVKISVEFCKIISDAISNPYQTHVARLAMAYEKLKSVSHLLKVAFFKGYIEMVKNLDLKDLDSIDVYKIPSLQTICHCADILCNDLEGIQLGAVGIQSTSSMDLHVIPWSDPMKKNKKI